MGVINVARAPDLSIVDVREALASIAMAVAPAARIHAEWVLKFDLNQTVSLITVQDAMQAAVDTDVGLVHSWMIGLSSAFIAKDENGELPEVGANLSGFSWDLTFAFWGFFDATRVNAALKSGQRIAEDESELLSATLIQNPTLGLDSPKVNFLEHVGLLDFASIDAHSFTDGQDVVVSQGAIKVRVDRQL
jgi:hypothetical protein